MLQLQPIVECEAKTMRPVKKRKGNDYEEVEPGERMLHQGP